MGVRNFLLVQTEGLCFSELGGFVKGKIIARQEVTQEESFMLWDGKGIRLCG